MASILIRWTVTSCLIVLPHSLFAAVPREEVTEAMSKKLASSFQLVEQLPAEETARMRGELDAHLRVVAEKYLPPEVTADSDETVRGRLAKFSFGPWDLDMNYNRLTVEYAVRRFKINVAAAAKMPRLSPEQVEAVKENLRTVAEAIQKEATAQLAGIVSDEEVRVRVEADVRASIANAEDFMNPHLKKPLPPAELDAFLVDFRARLTESAPRAKARMEATAQAPDDETRKEERQIERRRISYEVCAYAFQALSRATLDATRTINHEEFDPGYAELRQQLRDASSKAMKARVQRSREQSAARRAETLRKLRQPDVDREAPPVNLVPDPGPREVK